MFLARLMDDLLNLVDVIVADLLTIFFFSLFTLVEVLRSLSVKMSIKSSGGWSRFTKNLNASIVSKDVSGYFTEVSFHVIYTFQSTKLFALILETKNGQCCLSLFSFFGLNSFFRISHIYPNCLVLIDL